MQKKELIKKGLNAALYTVPLRSLSQIISMLAAVVLIRILSKNDFGVYSLLYSSIAMIGMVASFGLGNVLQRYLPEYYARGEITLARKMFHGALVLRFLASALILLTILVFWNQLATRLHVEQYRHYFALFIFIIILHQQRGLINICLGAAYLHKYFLTFSILFTTIKFTGYIWGYFLGVTLTWILTVDLCAYLFLIAGLIWAYRSYFPINGENQAGFDKRELKRIVRYGLYYNFNSAGVKVLGADIDNFLIAYFLDPLSVGVYAFCTRVTRMIISIMPSTFFQDVLRPLFFGLAQGADLEKKQLGFGLLLKLQYIFSIPVFFIIWPVAAGFIGFFFGDRYVGYSNIFIIVFGFRILDGFTRPVGLMAQLEEKAGIILLSKIFVIYNLVSAFVLIPALGILGAAIATGTARLLKDFFIWWFVRDKARFKDFPLFFMKTCLYWGGASYILVLLNSYFLLEADLFLAGLLFPVLFFFYLKLNLFNPAEKEILRKITKPYKHYRLIRWVVYQDA